MTIKIIILQDWGFEKVYFFINILNMAASSKNGTYKSKLLLTLCLKAMRTKQALASGCLIGTVFTK